MLQNCMIQFLKNNMQVGTVSCLYWKRWDCSNSHSSLPPDRKWLNCTLYMSECCLYIFPYPLSCIHSIFYNIFFLTFYVFTVLFVPTYMCFLVFNLTEKYTFSFLPILLIICEDLPHSLVKYIHPSSPLLRDKVLILFE